MNPSPRSNASVPTRVRSFAETRVRSFAETTVRSFGRAAGRDSDSVLVVMRSLVGVVMARGIIATGSVEGQFDILRPALGRARFPPRGFERERGFHPAAAPATVAGEQSFDVPLR